MRLKTFEKLWHTFNADIFDNAMFVPKFRRTRSRSIWAYYLDGTIVVNYKNHPEMGAIVYHEMVHQYVEEVLGIEEEDHHGPVFWGTYNAFAPAGMSLAEKF